jgi:hypothetical protein
MIAAGAEQKIRCPPFTFFRRHAYSAAVCASTWSANRPVNSCR